MFQTGQDSQSCQRSYLAVMVVQLGHCVWLLVLAAAMGDVLSDLELQCRQLSPTDAGWRSLCDKYTSVSQPQPLQGTCGCLKRRQYYNVVTLTLELNE